MWSVGYIIFIPSTLNHILTLQHKVSFIPILQHKVPFLLFRQLSKPTRQLHKHVATQSPIPIPIIPTCGADPIKLDIIILWYYAVQRRYCTYIELGVFLISHCSHVFIWLGLSNQRWMQTLGWLLIATIKLSILYYPVVSALESPLLQIDCLCTI
jgi:hypothetical protein